VTFAACELVQRKIAAAAASPAAADTAAGVAAVRL